MQPFKRDCVKTSCSRATD